MSEGNCLVVFPEVDFEADRQRHQRLRRLYDLGIRTAVEEKLHLTPETKVRLSCRLVRPAAVRDEKIPELVQQLGTARAVVLNLDGCEADVLYLAGVCHGLALPAVLIAASFQDVPPLLQAYPTVIYHEELTADALEGFRRELVHALTRAVDTAGEQENPIQAYFPYDYKPVPRRAFVAKQKKIEELRHEVRRLQEELEQETAPSESTGSIRFRKV